MSEMPQTIPAMLQRCAGERGEDIAVSSLAGTICHDLTYREWEARSARVAATLAGRGVRQGVRVVVPCAYDWPSFAVAYLGVLWAGGTVVPVAARMGEAHVVRIAEQSKAAGLIYDEPMANFRGWSSSLSNLEGDTGTRVRGPNAEPDDVAEIIYTSGTTGAPKGIAATHRNLLWPLLRAGRKDRASTLPTMVMHSLSAGSNAGQTLLLQSLSPAPHRMLTLPFAADSYVQAIVTYRPSEIVLVPVHAIAITRIGRPAAGDLNSVRLVRNTSAAISPATLSALAELFPSAAISNMYTSTEAWPGRVRCTFAPDRPRSVGRAERDTQLRIVDGGAEVPAGEVGGIEIRASGAPARWYDGDPAATTAVFRADGWVRTGDRGYLDTDGYLYLTGRDNEIINSGGHNISPLEIDAAMEEHPSVIEAVTYGVPHRSLGEYVACAVRVSTNEIEASELREWCATRLGPVKAPKRIHVVTEFPRTATGKVIRSELARTMGEGDGRSSGQSAQRESIRLIWAAALDPDLAVQEDSDFLELGGTSLEAAEVTAKVRDLTNRRVRERDLYEARSLSEYVDRALRAETLTAEDHERARLSRVARSHAE